MQKTSKIKKILIFYNAFLLIFLAVIVFNHHNLENKFSNFRLNAIQYVKYNPMQKIGNKMYASVNYIYEFFTFTAQKEEISDVMIDVSSISQAYNRTKNINRELLNVLHTLQNTEKMYSVQAIVKLVYNIKNNLVNGMIFEYDGEIANNSFLLNEECLIGRVLNRENNLYYVLLFSDKNFRIPVYTKHTKVFGMMYGGEYPQFIPFKKYLQNSIYPDEEIITASYDEKFVDGITVGFAKKEKNKIFIKNNCKDYYTYALII